MGTSKNHHRSRAAWNLLANDSGLFPFRFCAVHPKDAGDCKPQEFFEVPVSRIGAGRLQQLAEVLNVPVSVFFDDTRHKTQDRDTVFAFLDTPYSLRLAEAFARMPDRPIRHRIVQLVEQIAHSITAAVRQSTEAGI